MSNQSLKISKRSSLTHALPAMLAGVLLLAAPWARSGATLDSSLEANRLAVAAAAPSWTDRVGLSERTAASISEELITRQESRSDAYSRLVAPNGPLGLLITKPGTVAEGLEAETLAMTIIVKDMPGKTR